MKGYRSIGVNELKMLVEADNPVYGIQRWDDRAETTCNLPYGVVCFFLDNIKWHDKVHKFDIVVELDDAQIGEGTYMASKEFGTSKVWTGKEGKTEYKLKEAYVRYYTPENIKELDYNGYFANWYVNKWLIPFCKKYHIVLKSYGKEIELS